MRIAQVATVSAPVRRHTPGSVEALVWLLARELTQLGHAVTVFGTRGSEVPGPLVETLPGPYATAGAPDDWHVCEWLNLCRAVERAAEFDVMHCHAYLWGLPLQPFSRTPLVHTLHIVPDPGTARLWEEHPAACVTALSQHQWSDYPRLQPAAVIPHGVDVADFTFQAQPEDYALYLGRFTSGKGARHAIAAARALGLRLVLAGPGNAYYREQIQPLIDGRQVSYAGFVTGAERDRLLGGARVLLYPIQYPESFGLVLVEAMLCGTPVAAIRLGAVPEIVEEGVTGCLADSMDSFAAAVSRSLALDRRRVRARAEHRFAAPAMAHAYARLYEQIASRC